MSICIMASLGVQSTIDGFGESSNSPTALNVHHGHQAAGGSRSDPMFAFTIGTISFFLWRKPFRKTQCSKAALLSLYVMYDKFVRSQRMVSCQFGATWSEYQTCFLLMVGKNWNTWRKHRQTWGEHVESRQKDPWWLKGVLNPGLQS